MEVAQNPARTVDAGPAFSVVVPVYGCAACLSELCARLGAVLDELTTRYEVVLVDDRSPDQSWAAIQSVAKTYPFVVGVRLSRNFGQHIAITAGLEAARGDLVVVMDCDLQDPPELIPSLYAKLQTGYDLVLARREERTHSPFRVWAAKFYFGLLSRLAEERIDGAYGTYCMLSRKVVDGFLRFRERERHFLFIVRWLGFDVGTVDYKHAERLSGRSSYSLKRLIRHAVDGIFFQTTVFLRWIVLVGLCCATIGLGLAAYFLYQFFALNVQPGWTSLAILTLISTGLNLTSVGVIGQYVGKIFEQTKERPLYVIDMTSPREKQW